MQYTLKSKFAIGDTVHMGTLGYIIRIEVVGIQFRVNEQGDVEVRYNLLDKEDPKWRFTNVEESYIERCNKYKVGKLSETEWRHL